MPQWDQRISEFESNNLWVANVTSAFTFLENVLNEVRVDCLNIHFTFVYFYIVKFVIDTDAKIFFINNHIIHSDITNITCVYKTTKI